MTQQEMIAHLNDLFRTTGLGGKTLMTRGVAALDEALQHHVLQAVRNFSKFNEDNDPHGEHDFGLFIISGQKFFWKIDYYDADYKYGAEKPWDTNESRRVLTVMLAEEY